MVGKGGGQKGGGVGRGNLDRNYKGLLSVDHSPVLGERPDTVTNEKVLRTPSEEKDKYKL